MNQTNDNRLTTLVFALMLSLFLGLLLSSGYVTFRDGFDTYALKNFSLLAAWQETPFVAGYVTDAFITCLKILAGSAVATTAVVFAILYLRGGDHHGTARWGSYSELARAGYIRRYHKVSGPIFGKTTSPKRRGKYLTNGDQPHSLVVAPTRAGKGVGVVVPTLLTFNGSILALDVKGELFELTSRSRLARGDRVFKFSPLDREGRTNSYNPILDIVKLPPERRFAETRRLAVNLLVPKGKGSEGFIDGARDLFVAGVLACIERGNPTIGAVYDLYTLPGEKYKLFAQLAEESEVPEVKRIFNNMAGNDTKIITSYTSVLGDGGLNLWADPLIKAATTTSDFSIYDLRRDPTSIFLVVSPNDLEVIAPLVRLFFQQVVAVLQREMPKEDEIFEVLFLLDEFKHLGKLESIETAVTTIAGYKGRFMFIIQSLAALTGAYETSGKENFLSNTGVQVFMATADDETPQYISKAIGDYSYKAKSVSWNQTEIFKANIQKSEQGATLIRPEQIRLLDDQTQIVLVKGKPPLMMPKVKYYEDRILKTLFESQTGPLPEPEPLKAVTEPASFLAALTGEEPAKRGSAHDPNDLEMGQEPENEIRVPSQVEQIQAAFEAEDFADAHDDVQEMQQQRIAREALQQQPEFEEEPQIEYEKTAQQALLERIIAVQERNRAQGISR